MMRCALMILMEAGAAEKEVTIFRRGLPAESPVKTVTRALLP